MFVQRFEPQGALEIFIIIITENELHFLRFFILF